jgi:hypothetical protein
MKKPRLLVVVHVKLFGFLAQLSAQVNLDIELETGSTVAGLIYRLTEQLGQDFRQAILDRDGNLHGGIEIILNGQHIPARRISEITIDEDGNLAIIPLVGGG